MMLDWSDFLDQNRKKSLPDYNKNSQLWQRKLSLTCSINCLILFCSVLPGTENLWKCSIECGVAGTVIATNTSTLNERAATLVLMTTKKVVTDRKFVIMQYWMLGQWQLPAPVCWMMGLHIWCWWQRRKLSLTECGGVGGQGQKDC